MSEIRVTVEDAGRRARNIMIGVVVVAVLTFWRVTGALPLMTAAMVPQPQSDALMFSWTFAVEIVSDLFYMIGVGATGLFSGLWALLTALVQSLYTRTTAQPVTQERLDNRTQEVFAAIEKPLNEISIKVNGFPVIEKALSDLAEKVRVLSERIDAREMEAILDVLARDVKPTVKRAPTKRVRKAV